MAATVAASVIDRYYRGSLPVGYLAHGSQSLMALPDRSMHQREQIMRHIAASRPVGEVTILESLAELERDLGQNTSLVVITAASNGPWVEALGGLAKRGVRVNTVLIDKASFGGDSNTDALEHLTIVGVSTYPLARGDSISNALLNPVGGSSQGLRQGATYRTRSELTEIADTAQLAESTDVNS